MEEQLEEQIREIYAKRGKIDILRELNQDISPAWTAEDVYKWIEKKMEEV